MISRRTAEISLLALDAVLRRTRHNGGPRPLDLVRALRELHAAAADVSPERPGPSAPAVELLTTRQAALRLGVSTRTVERRAVAGLIPANRVGRNFQIIWNDPLHSDGCGCFTGGGS